MQSSAYIIDKFLCTYFYIYMETINYNIKYNSKIIVNNTIEGRAHIFDYINVKVTDNVRICESDSNRKIQQL